MATQANKNIMKEPPKGDPWMVQVDVILDPSTRTFKFETDLPKGEKNKLFFYNEGHPGFVITFHLKDPTYDYRFPEDLDEALFSVDEAVCPTEHGQWNQFKAKAITDNGRNLVVRNHNKDKVEFGYTLRVTQDGTEFWNLDPIGGNENGSYQSNWD